MTNETRKFDSYVINGIIANNQFGIKEVNRLFTLKSIFFKREEYSEIEKLIKAGNIEAIKGMNNSQSQAEEYLEVMTFKDQNQKDFIVTVYDSNALEQDPQVIDIYKL